jgi:hypothetical protein
LRPKDKKKRKKPDNIDICSNNHLLELVSSSNQEESISRQSQSQLYHPLDGITIFSRKFKDLISNHIETSRSKALELIRRRE